MMVSNLNFLFCIRMRIGLDMMGGDFAPLEAVKGIQLYLAEHSNPVDLYLIGDQPQVEQLLAAHSIPLTNIKVVHAEEVIDMHEHPAEALREKQKSSIAIGFHLRWRPEKRMLLSALAIPVRCWLARLFSIKALEGYYDRLFLLLSRKKMAVQVYCWM